VILIDENERQPAKMSHDCGRLQSRVTIKINISTGMRRKLDVLNHYQYLIKLEKAATN
jgi:hypothetical protein